MRRFLLIIFILFCFSCETAITMPEYNPPANIDEENYPVDRREFPRLKTKKMKTKIYATNSTGQNLEIIDISRGGIAFKDNNNFTVGNNYNFELKYQNVTIPLETNVIAIENNKVRTKYTNLDIPKQNKLIYLTSKIEIDNNWFKTKLSGEDGKEFFEWES